VPAMGRLVFLILTWRVSDLCTSLEHDCHGLGTELAYSHVAGASVSHYELGDRPDSFHPIHCQYLDNFPIQLMDCLFPLSLHHTSLDCEGALYSSCTQSHFKTRKQVHCLALDSVLLLYLIHFTGLEVILLSMRTLDIGPIGRSRHQFRFMPAPM